MKTVIIVGNEDIFFRAKLEQLTRASGGAPISVTSPAELSEAIEQEKEDSLVVIDIERSIDNLQEIVKSIGRARSIAFYPHVRIDLLQRAKEAGSTKVIPRSSIENSVKRFLEQG